MGKYHYQMVAKSTLILGASLNELRYSNKAIKKLVSNKIIVFAVGKNIGETHGVKILNNFPKGAKIDTISVYLNIKLQDQYVDSIIDISPRRVIFNPGTVKTHVLWFCFLPTNIKQINVIKPFNGSNS